jgi:multidrug resistance efflux pump
MDKEQLNSKLKEMKNQAGINAQKTKDSLGKVFDKENVKKNLKKAKVGVEKAVDVTLNSSFIKKMSSGQKLVALGVLAFIVIVIVSLIGRSIFTPDLSIWCAADAPKVELAFNSAGEVSNVECSEKQTVPEGQIIARLQGETYIADLESASSKLMVANLKFLRMENRLVDMENALAQSKLKAAESANEAAISAFELARAYEELNRSHFEKRLIMEEQWLTSINEVANAEAVVKEAVNNLEKAKQYLETTKIGYSPEEIANAKEEVDTLTEQITKAKAALEGTIIVAPFNAYINSISIKTGDVVESGKPVCEVIDFSKTWLNGHVDKSKAESIKPGSTVNVEFNEIPKIIFTGKVVSVSEQPVERNDGKVLYELRIELDNPDNNILPKMEAVAIVVSK